MTGEGALEELVKRDPRYSLEAYQFVLDALTFTVKRIGEKRHVTGRELLLGLRDLAVDWWGLMARHVLSAWGIKSTDDVGQIVFNMVNAGLLSKTERDSIDDFHNIFQFEEAFEQRARPELDEHGHIRRNPMNVRHAGNVTWGPFFGQMGVN